MKDETPTENTSTPAIIVRNVSKTFRIPHEKISTLKGAFIHGWKKRRYEEFQAVDDVSFEIRKGEFFGILGRNGSGKSTLLKMLAEIYTPDSGEINIDGRISPFLELGIGFNPELSGRDNVYLNATVLGLSKKEINERFESIVSFSELERFIDQKIKNYSSGMQVRLAFAVAIHANREILLMDEVLAVGDISFQKKCIREFQKYRDQGKTVVLVTHDMDTLQKYCERALLLRNGKVEFIGDPADAVKLYMRQLRSDEEALIEETATESETKTSGSDLITIDSIELLDENTESKSVFHVNDSVHVRVQYEAKKPIQNPVLEIAIQMPEGMAIGVMNSLLSQFELPSIEGRGQFEVVIKNLPLAGGRYGMRASINDYNRTLGDAAPEIVKPFTVIEMAQRQLGFVALESTWKHIQL